MNMFYKEKTVQLVWMWILPFGLGTSINGHVLFLYSGLNDPLKNKIEMRQNLQGSVTCWVFFLLWLVVSSECVLTNANKTIDKGECFLINLF